MKSLKSILMVTLIAGFMGLAAMNLKAAEKLDSNLIKNGDFSAASGELNFTDPVFSPEFGPCFNWGSGNWDSYVTAMADPQDSSNTILKFYQSKEGFAWSSLFTFVSIAPGTTYNVSLDYKMAEGQTDNFGMRFAGSPACENVFLGTGTPIDGKDGWFHCAWTWETAADANYDSIGIWMNTMNGAAVGYLDNVSVVKADDGTQVVSHGDFEGFLDYAPTLALSAEKDEYNNTGENSAYGNGVLEISNGGWFANEPTEALVASKYAVSFDLVGASGTVNVALVKEDGTVDHEENVAVENKAVYVVLENEEAVKVRLSYTGDADTKVVVDNLKLQGVLDWPFEEGTTYYPGKTTTVNGDFEAFEEGTVFSETQLEGAWGSLASYDNPAKIEAIDGTKAMTLRGGEKTYSSCFLMTPDTWEAGDLVRLEYDVKTQIGDEVNTYISFESSFVGGSNVEYYTIDYKKLTDDTVTFETSGAEGMPFIITVTKLDNAWVRLTLDFQVTNTLLIKCNSLRWLFTAHSEEDVLYIDNVNFYNLSTTEPSTDVAVTGVSINQGNSTLKVGETLDLTCTVAPEDATNKAVVWSSSNEKVATVDENGHVVAVAKGACSITVKTEDGSYEASIAITVTQPSSSSSSSGCKKANTSLVEVIVPVFAMVGVLGVVALRRKQH